MWPPQPRFLVSRAAYSVSSALGGKFAAVVMQCCLSAGFSIKALIALLHEAWRTDLYCDFGSGWLSIGNLRICCVLASKRAPGIETRPGIKILRCRALHIHTCVRSARSAAHDEIVAVDLPALPAAARGLVGRFDIESYSDFSAK